MRNVEEELNMLLQERGYIVIDGRDVDLRVGDLIGGVHADDGSLNHSMAVIQKTDLADWTQQQLLLGETAVNPSAHNNYYRVTAE
jgi:uncharacterized cupin superfamily protein